jgi:hypothetical protein
MASTTVESVTLFGRVLKVALPDFAACEELNQAYWEATRKKGAPSLRRVYAAVLGLCCTGKAGASDYARHEFSVLAYGGQVFDELRKQGMTYEELVEVARPLVLLVIESTFPKKAEVDAALGNSKGNAEG